jgi:hypothetical protein
MTHPKRPRDPNQLAKSIIDIATGQKPDRDPTPEQIHVVVMALPPDKRRDREKVNAAVRDGFRLGPLRRIDQGFWSRNVRRSGRF